MGSSPWVIFAACLFGCSMIDHAEAGLHLYEGDNFEGAELELEGPVSDLLTRGWNNRTGSIKVKGICDWELCPNVGFVNCERFVKGQYNKAALTRRMGATKIASSSRRVNGITLYTGNFRGNLFHLYPMDGMFGIADLALHNYDDVTQSIKIHGGGDGPWQVCPKPYFRGSCMTLSKEKTTLADLVAGLGNPPSISSVRLIGPYPPLV